MKRATLFLIPMLVIGFAVLMMMSGSSPSAKQVSFAVKKDGKIYMYSSMGAFITEKKLSQGETPPLLPIGGLVVLDDGYYIKAGSIEEFANIFSNNFSIYEHKEISYDGYMAAGELDVYDKKYISEATEQIGVMRNVVKVVLSNPKSNETYTIRWVRPPGDLEAIENCLIKTVIVDRSYRPGETTYTWEDEIVVRLDDIIQFYDPSITVEYDEEHSVLFLNL